MSKKPYTRTSVITGRPLKHLHTFKDFPVFMGVTDEPAERDIFADMTWGIDEHGVIQLIDVLPLEWVYQNQHNDGYGKTWQAHYDAFARFVAKYVSGSILEIGAAHDAISSRLPIRPWTIVDPNPTIEDPTVNVIKGWFDENFSGDYQTIIHSHVLEHAYDPKTFLQHIYDLLPVGGRCIFTVPNLRAILQNKQVNCLNFEHTVFLTDEVIEHLASLAGFNILEKHYHGRHSIFFAIEKQATKAPIIPLPDRTEENVGLFTALIESCQELARVAEGHDPHLFGGHIWSQFHLHFGVQSSRPILDNSPRKQGKRLYGTSLKVINPANATGEVFVHTGLYDEEIKTQLRAVNPGITII